MRPLPRAFGLMGRNGTFSGQPGNTQPLGIALICAAVFTFTLMDATAKYLTQFYHPLQVVWARFAINLLLIVLVARAGTMQLMRTRQPGVQFWRALAQVASIMLFFTSLQYIGLAEATAIMDTNPVLITLGAALFLGEAIGIRRILGIAAALIGAMIVIQPGADLFQPAALLPMVGAFTYAAGALLTRAARQDSVMTTLLWSAVVGTVIASAILPFIWQTPAARHLWAFAALGVFGSLSQVMLIRAFALAEASVLAPFGYSGLVWAALWGWLIFDQIPAPNVVIGAAIIVAAGLYVWWREAGPVKSGP